MKKLFFLLFIIFSFCINAEKFSEYTEVSESEYILVYETNGFYSFDAVNGIWNEVENGKYKFVDGSLITYLSIKDGKFHGIFYVYTRDTNKLLSEFGFKNGIADGKWMEYDKNEKPALIDYLKNDYIMKREIFVNGKLVITKTFKDGLYRLPWAIISGADTS